MRSLPSNGASYDELTHFFKARLGKQLFDNSAYYQILNDRDETVNEALRLLMANDPLAEARG